MQQINSPFFLLLCVMHCCSLSPETGVSLTVQMIRFMQLSKIWNWKFQPGKSKMYFHKIFVKYSCRNSWVGITEREVSSDREQGEWNRVWREELKLGLLLTELIWNDSLGDFSKAGLKIWVSSANQQCISKTNKFSKQWPNFLNELCSML